VHELGRPVKLTGSSQAALVHVLRSLLLLFTAEGSGLDESLEAGTWYCSVEVGGSGWPCAGVGMACEGGPSLLPLDGRPRHACIT